MIQCPSRKRGKMLSTFTQTFFFYIHDDEVTPHNNPITCSEDKNKPIKDIDENESTSRY